MGTPKTIQLQTTRATSAHAIADDNTSTEMTPISPSHKRSARSAQQSASTDSLQMYLRSLPLIPFPTRDQEVALGRQVQQGILVRQKNSTAWTKEEEELVAKGNEAASTLFVSFGHLVIAMAKRYQVQGQCIDQMDLIQEGNIGLWKAIAKFDPERGVRFSTYAAWWIRQAMSLLLPYGQSIIIPHSAFDEIRRIKKARQQLAQSLHRDPNPQEVASYLGLPIEAVTQALSLSTEAVSIYAPIEEDDESCIGDQIIDPQDPPETKVLHTLLCEELQAELMRLDERHRQIIIERYGLGGAKPRTQAAIAKTVGRSVKRVQQIEAATLKKLAKSPSLQRLFRDYYQS